MHTNTEPSNFESPALEGVSVGPGDLLLANTELHQNNYKIMSYGCSINVHQDQSIWSQRLARYGLPGPQITTLDQQGWINQESIAMVEGRFVAEMSRRLGTEPKDVSIAFLSKKLKTEIPTEDLAKDRKEHVNLPTDEETLMKTVQKASWQSPQTAKEHAIPFQFNAVSLRGREEPKENERVLVPSWGQYVKVASLDTARFDTFRWRPKLPSSAAGTMSVESIPFRKDSLARTLLRKARLTNADVENTGFEQNRNTVTATETPKRQPSKPPRTVVEQTIQWSTSSDIFFTPLSAETAQPRRTLLSPRDLRDDEYLGDAPGYPSSMPSETERVPLDIAEKADIQEKRGNMLAQQKRLMEKLRASGEDRL